MIELFNYSGWLWLFLDSPERWLKEYAHWLEILLSEKSLTLGTWALAIVTALLALATWLVVRRERERRKEAQRQRDSMMRICRVKHFDPGQVVGAYSAANVTEYLPIPQDSEIEKTLNIGNYVLISGRPGIGKSHTAVRHILAFRNWFLIRPAKSAVRNLHLIRLKRRRYILFFDDHQEYIEELDGGASILDLVDRVRAQSKKLIVIATIRSTLPEFEAIGSESKLLGRWMHFELQDWSLQQGQELAKRTKIDMKGWDGTPLSVKQPSTEMEAKYRLAPYEQKAIIRSLKLLSTFRIKPSPRPIVRDLYLSKIFNGSPEAFEPALSAVDSQGFLKTGTDLIEAYDPYVESVGDWECDAGAYVMLRDLLVEQNRVDELLAVGRKWYHEADYDEAENVYRRCVELNPKMERCHYRLGLVLARTSRWSEAATHFEEATRLSPGWAAAWYRLSNALNRQGKPDEGKKAFRRAQSVGKSDDPVLRCRRAEGLRMGEQLDAALAEIESVIEANPKLAEAFYVKGRVLWDFDRAQEAVEAYRDAIRLDPEMAEAYLGLGIALRHVGDKTGAEQAYRAAIRLSPRFARVYSYLGTLLKELDRAEEGVEAYRDAIRLDPGMAEAYFGLGLALRDQPQETAQAYRHAIRLGIARKVDSYFGLGTALNRLGDYAGAEQAFREAIRLNPRFALAHSCLGAVLENLDRLKEAVEALREAIRLNPTSADACLGLGIALRKLGDYAGAEQAYREALKLDPEMAEAYFGLGEPLRKLGDNTGAEKVYREAIRLNPDLADAHSYLGQLLMDLGQLSEGESEMRKAIALHPNSPEFHSYLGELLAKYRSRFTEMEQEFRQAIRLRPDYPEAFVGLAMSLRLQGKVEEAIDANLKAINLSPKMAEGYFGLGLCYVSQKKWDLAVNAYREAIRLRPELDAAHFLLGRTLISLNKPAEALEELKTALGLGYDSGKVNFQMARAYSILGSRIEALDCFERAVENGFNVNPEHLRRDPALRGLRSDPRFQRLAMSGSQRS